MSVGLELSNRTVFPHAPADRLRLIEAHRWLNMCSYIYIYIYTHIYIYTPYIYIYIYMRDQHLKVHILVGLHIEARSKWRAFCRRYFQTSCIERKYLNFNPTYIEIGSPVTKMSTVLIKLLTWVSLHIMWIVGPPKSHVYLKMKRVKLSWFFS